MKLFGNNKKSRHLNKHSKARDPKNHKKRGGRIVLRAFTVFVLVIVGLFAAAVAYLRWGVSPPDVNFERRPGSTQNSDSGNSSPGASAQNPDRDGDAEARNERKFTFLVLGTDDSDALTDVIMVGTFNADSYTLNVVSIPRDTLMNVSWSVRKANSILPNALAQTRGQENRQERAMEIVVDHFANVLGFEVDFYVRVDMRAFTRLVDAIGGVEFYVPRTMSHEEFAQTYRRGYHNLSGRQALDIVRFRGFADGDIGRIGTQQAFLTSAVQQILENSDEIRYRDIISIFLNYVETDLSFGNLLWFAQSFLRMDAENVHFATMPGNYNDRINGLSYVTIFVDEWLEMLNEMLNPFDEDITREELSILTRSGGSNSQLIVTDGNFAGNQQWGQPGRAQTTPPSTTTNAPTTPTNPPTEPTTPTVPDRPGDDDPTQPTDTTDPTEQTPPDDGDGPAEPTDPPTEPPTELPTDTPTEPPPPSPPQEPDEQDAA